MLETHVSFPPLHCSARRSWLCALPRRDAGDEYEARRRDATLFVGDLPAAARSDDLIGLFSAMAPVAEAKVIGGQGFGFVTFMDPEMAADVLAVCELPERMSTVLWISLVTRLVWTRPCLRS